MVKLLSTLSANYLEDRVEKRLGDGLKARFDIPWLGEPSYFYFKFRPAGIVGIPDRILLLPGGRLIFVELKKPDGQRSPMQIRMHATLRRLGFLVATLYTLEQVDNFLHSL